MQTKERRIYLEYMAGKKKWDYRRSGLPALRMFICRKHKIPMRDLKKICESKGL